MYDSSNEDQPPGKAWIPDEALESMIMERSLIITKNTSPLPGVSLTRIFL